MKKPLYLINEGVIYKKDNTLYYQNKEIKKVLPINRISDIFCYSHVTIRSGALYYLMTLNIPAHFFNKYGFYIGSLYPKDYLISGKITVLQAKYYLELNKRMEIAKEIVNGIKYNVLKTLKYYANRGKNIDLNKIKSIEINKANDPYELLSLEGKIWDNYYNEFNKILKSFNFEKRTIRPPKDEINSLISFGNSLLYSITLTEIYNTYLNPSISFLHEPRERRYSLALDISELFKPLFVERTIFKLVNKGKIDEKCFDRIGGGFLLNKKGKREFIKEFDEKLNTTIKHPTLKRKVSYRRLIRLECYKLIKHILNDKKYKSFRMLW